MKKRERLFKKRIARLDDLMWKIGLKWMTPFQRKIALANVTQLLRERHPKP